MAKIHNIAKNTSYLTVALIFQKVISFAYFAMLARYLGPEDLGKYYFAISFTAIFAIFIDLGFANVLTREVAKDASRSERLLGNVLAMKIPLAIFALIAVFASINGFYYDPLVKVLVYISCISMLLDSFTYTFFAIARGRHNLKYESISSIIFQLIVLVFGYGALLLNGGLIPAMGALALASSFNFVYSWFIVTKKLKVKLAIIYDKYLLKEIILISLPFAMYGIFQRLYMYLDSVLLAFFAGNEQVGLYQVAFKIIFALQFLPMAFSASLYPAMSAYWKDNREQLLISFERALNYLIIISWPIVIGVIILADKIVLIFKSGYGGAILPLQISIISLFFLFINFPIGSLLNACDRQRKNTINMGIVMIISILANLILIPRLQAVGASITVLMTNILMSVLGISTVKHIIPYKITKNLKVLLKTLISVGLMGLIIFVSKPYLNIFILIPVSGILYFYFLYLFGGFKKEDVQSVFKSLKI